MVEVLFVDGLTSSLPSLPTHFNIPDASILGHRGVKTVLSRHPSRRHGVLLAVGTEVEESGLETGRILLRRTTHHTKLF